MSSFASALKFEISRIARKESCAQAAPLHRAKLDLSAGQYGKLAGTPA